MIEKASPEEARVGISQEKGTMEDPCYIDDSKGPERIRNTIQTSSRKGRSRQNILDKGDTRNPNTSTELTRSSSVAGSVSGSDAAIRVRSLQGGG